MARTALSDSHLGDPVASLFSDNVSLLNAEEWLLQTDYSASKKSFARSISENRREQIKEILISILPDVSANKMQPSNTERETVSARIMTHNGWVEIENLA